MRIAQITDIHMIAGPPEPGGYDPGAALAAVLEALAPLRPDILLLTGDIAANGRPAEYARVRDAVAALGVPALAVPGNHDVGTAFRDGLASATIRIGEGPGLWLEADGPVRLIGLDTLAPDGAAAGVLGEAQLAWVADRLALDDPRPILVFMHHPPFSVGLAMDWTRVAEGNQLGALVMAHPRVLGVTCGHLHRAARLAWAGTIGGVSPSVAWEIPLDMPTDAVPVLVPSDPAFQLHVLHPELGLVTHSQTVTIDGATGVFPAAPNA